jgi:hypothetical protein
MSIPHPEAEVKMVKPGEACRSWFGGYPGSYAGLSRGGKTPCAVGGLMSIVRALLKRVGPVSKGNQSGREVKY